MTCDPRYDILFEPVKIGPVTAKNRFYQVPHCTGMGWLRPRMVADYRATKAERKIYVSASVVISVTPAIVAMYRFAAPKSVKRIGDAEAPSIIAAATFVGHKYARELDCEIDADNLTKHDRVFFDSP